MIGMCARGCAPPSLSTQGSVKMKKIKQSISTFEEAEQYINDTPKFTAKNKMEDTREFLRRLGNPDGKMRMIHVAGTNGKGSVCAYLRSILEAAGYRVALFTSPHLVEIRERFVVEGEMISKEAFLRIFLQVYEMLDWEALEAGSEKAYHPTYFEYLLWIALVYFGERKPDFCILETGLGGRLDATNAISQKEVSIITHISLDHVEYLGDTVEKIAWEKAGIMQKGAPAICWETSPEIRSVFQNYADELGISCRFVSENDYSFSNFNRKTIDFCLRTEYYRCVSLSLHTMAPYQMENCALAIRAIETFDRGKTVTLEHIVKGAAECFWPGRMEEVLPNVYVDGAHNEDGIRVFLETVAGDGHGSGRSLLFGVVKEKDYGRMVEELVSAGLFDKIALAHMRTNRGVSVEELKTVFEKYPDCKYEIYDNVASAFRGLLQNRKDQERIYAAGSLYLVGEIKELLDYDKF